MGVGQRHGVTDDRRVQAWGDRWENNAGAASLEFSEVVLVFTFLFSVVPGCRVGDRLSVGAAGVQLGGDGRDLDRTGIVCQRHGVLRCGITWSSAGGASAFGVMASSSADKRAEWDGRPLHVLGKPRLPARSVGALASGHVPKNVTVVFSVADRLVALFPEHLCVVRGGGTAAKFA